MLAYFEFKNNNIMTKENAI